MNVPLPSPQASPTQWREFFRQGTYIGPTAGFAPGFVQTNLVILPIADAEDFEHFCRLNPRPCPLIARTQPGDPEPREVAPGADLRTDLPRYRVFRDGKAVAEEPTEIKALWQKDLVAFLIGCSFTFERALVEAGLQVRHLQLGRNVPMYRTNISCKGVGKFAGPMVVSMRPYLPEQLEQVQRISGQFPRMHGEPIHVGNPAQIGIEQIESPDFGDPVPLLPGETPVFWACGVTPQLALEQARLPLAITHAPGSMFLTDLGEEEFLEIT